MKLGNRWSRLHGRAEEHRDKDLWGPRHWGKSREEPGRGARIWTSIKYLLLASYTRHVRVYVLSCFNNVWLFATLWTAACQAPLSMELSKQEYWRGLSIPTPRYLPNPRIKPMSLAFPAMANGFFTTVPPGEQVSQSREGKNDLDTEDVVVA